MSDKDKLLISLLKGGNSFAFEKLYYKYSKKLYNFSYNICKNQEDAEGVVQYVFMKVWETRSEINTDLSFKGYIFRIAKNNLLNYLKKKVNEKAYLNYLMTVPEEGDITAKENIEYLELDFKIESLIKNIPERRREIFLLSRKDGLTYREISEKLNISVNTVNTQISKSLEYIRDSLDNNYLPSRIKADRKNTP